VCRYVLAAVLLAAAVSKITDLHGFRDFLAVHAGLAPPAAFAVAAFLPWLELTCGLCLASGQAAREAAVLTLVLLVAFVAHGLAHPVEADCGCAVWPAQVSLPPGGPWLHGRNLLLMGCAIVTALRGD
jgi:uncharacterized membrane protein YphA (DoxX/SURF4 family)